MTSTPAHAQRQHAPEPNASNNAWSNLRIETDGGFGAFVRAHQGEMRSYLGRRVPSGSGVSVDDALQEALIRIWRQWDAWPADATTGAAHLHHALKLAAIDAFRALHGRGHGAGVRTVTDRPDATDHAGNVDHAAMKTTRAAPDPAERCANRSDVLAALATLAARDRQVLVLTACGHNSREIAAFTGDHHHQVRQQLMRARRRARRSLERSARPDEALVTPAATLTTTHSQENHP